MGRSSWSFERIGENISFESASLREHLPWIRVKIEKRRAQLLEKSEGVDKAKQVQTIVRRVFGQDMRKKLRRGVTDIPEREVKREKGILVNRVFVLGAEDAELFWIDIAAAICAKEMELHFELLVLIFTEHNLEQSYGTQFVKKVPENPKSILIPNLISFWRILSRAS
jgi:hypothetical protein